MASRKSPYGELVSFSCHFSLMAGVGACCLSSRGGSSEFALMATALMILGAAVSTLNFFFCFLFLSGTNGLHCL